MKYKISLLVVLILFSCIENEELITIDLHNKIVGSWSYAEYSEDNTVTFKRVHGIIDDEYSFTLKNNGSFIEHKNAGWFGTPPISYADFEGNWSEK